MQQEDVYYAFLSRTIAASATTLLQVSKIATNRESLDNDTLYVRYINAYTKGGRSYNYLDMRRKTLKSSILASIVV